MDESARNLTDAVDGFFTGKRYLIHDRDPLYTKEFLSILKDAGVLSVKLPPRSPKFESICGKICPHDQGRLSGANDPLRPRRSAQSDSGVRCTLSPRAKSSGAAQPLIVPIDAVTEKTGPVRRRQRLGGMLNYYYRDAAWQFESGWFLMCESSFWIVRGTEKIFRQLTARTEKGDGYKRLDLRVSPREKARR
jgi:putative transposase